MGRKKSEMQFSSLQVAWLIAFVESADHKRASAASMLGVRPGTVSKYIDKLGEWVGGGPCQLLAIKNSHPLILTDAGKAFLPDARKALEHLREAHAKAGEISPLLATPYGPPKPPKFFKIPSLEK